ncbi:MULTISPECIES: helix-turn-helix transcriptional regulator [unclassified Rhizobium]|uniref:helix-turn-helix domain-containing protein n=1 Tax=unclassified Rhizobium TaxID=2613769 RepID=UPI000CDF345B|nr:MULTISPECIES: helix-turn-helix transcriptional regulator [Rhizobium]AVA20964.1 XRE family transcriptional regulator protein [Rhizobium sp. NXC24]MDK4739107.1 helix-turn-helix transcriptional regulator [Rhizobium sp. CNPSo 3464]UWU22169.1 helix-turn-helix transcriptional regulator [Rhizobium tropici]
MTNSNTAISVSKQLGPLLRHWREVRGKSQLDLSMETGVSQRHISFVESGRSVPSRQRLLTVAEALDVPFRERNTLLLAAGYAPIYSDDSWDAPEMQPVADALRRMLRQHEPFPAVVMDRYWNVLLSNTAVPRFFNCFVDMAARKSPRNLLHLMFDPVGMRPFIRDWPETSRSLLARVHRESIGRVVDDKTRELLKALLAYPDVDVDWKALTAPSSTPVIPLVFVKDGKNLGFFSLITTVGTPMTIASQELRLECMFPTDQQTERLYAEMMEDAPMPIFPADHY